MANVLTRPSAYLYSGVRLPLTTWDGVYPHTFIFKNSARKCTAYCSTSPLTVDITSSDYTDHVLKVPGPCAIYYFDDLTNIDWSSPSTYDDGYNGLLYLLGDPVWSSHTILSTSGSTYFPASDKPAAVYEGDTENNSESNFDIMSYTIGLAFGLSDGLNLIDNSMFEDDESYIEDDEENKDDEENGNDNQLWETLFEGEVTTTYSDNAGTTGDGVIDYPFVAIADLWDNFPYTGGDGIRLTIDGVSYVYTATVEGTWKFAGNRALSSDFDDAVLDDGNPIAIRVAKILGIKLSIFTRTPGTYTVKIERALFEPVAYLYNGVRLPDINTVHTVDMKETHPYAYITDGGIIGRSNRRLYLTDYPLNATQKSEDTADVFTGVNSCGVKVNYAYYKPSDDGTRWEYLSESTLTFGHVYIPYWCNTDMDSYLFVYVADGDSYYEPLGFVGLAASEPIPVYE